LAAAVLAAILYFAPLYLEGLAENWELILFVLGIILLGVEIFVIPGFGVAGIAGIALMVTGLTLAMIDNIVFSMDPEYAIKVVLRSVLIIVLSSIGSILIILRLGKSTASAGFLGKLALEAIQDHAEGYVSSDPEQKKLIGKTGIALTDLKPSGKIEVEDDVYVAMSEIGYIPKGTEIKIIRDESSHVYVIKTT
jgi:membrane-bound serine protease (ClpP class)